MSGRLAVYLATCAAAPTKFPMAMTSWGTASRFPPTAAGGIEADPVEEESPVAEAEAERAPEALLLPSVAEARREPKALEAKAEPLALAVLLPGTRKAGASSVN